MTTDHDLGVRILSGAPKIIKRLKIMMNKNLKNEANHQPLSPISFLLRTAEIFPDHVAWIYGKKKCR